MYCILKSNLSFCWNNWYRRIYCVSFWHQKISSYKHLEKRNCRDSLWKFICKISRWNLLNLLTTNFILKLMINNWCTQYTLTWDKESYVNSLFILLAQDAEVPLHTPSVWHFLAWDPISWNPLKQLKWTTAPYVKSDPWMRPLARAPRPGHLMAASNQIVNKFVPWLESKI